MKTNAILGRADQILTKEGKTLDKVLNGSSSNKAGYVFKATFTSDGTDGHYQNLVISQDNQEDFVKACILASIGKADVTIICDVGINSSVFSYTSYKIFNFGVGFNFDEEEAMIQSYVYLIIDSEPEVKMNTTDPTHGDDVLIEIPMWKVIKCQYLVPTDAEFANEIKTFIKNL